MRKRNLKPMIISALLAIGFGATSVGTSFALFTDSAETSINVTAGKVAVTNAVTITEAASLGGTADTLTSVATDKLSADFQNGGKAEVKNDGSVAITNWTPGDSITLLTAPDNGSNVKTKFRLVVTINGQLAPALITRVNGVTDNSTMACKGVGSLYTGWSVKDVNQDPEAYSVKVEFPNSDNLITSRDTGVDNQYQEKSAVIKISYEAVQANANVSTALIDLLNTRLATKRVAEGKNNTFTDALGDVADLADVDDIATEELVWNVVEDRFYYEDDATTAKHNFFKIYETAAANFNEYSVYASEWSNVATVNLTGVGFDAGTVEGIQTVNYTGNTAAHTVTIRTNSLNTSVTVNAKNDVVKHYGDAQYVDIQAVASSSYHEYGRVALVNVANGRIALEKDSDVDKVHFTATEDVFKEITVAYDKTVTLPDFSRDAVEEIPATGRLVVKLEDDVDQAKAKKDYIWLYQDGLVQQIRVSASAESAGNVKATDEEVSVNTNKVADDIANVLDGNNNVVETGIKANEKEAYIEEVVEDYLSRDDVRGSYKYRINGDYYATFEAAFNAVKENETIRILDDDNITRPKVGDSYTEYSITKNFTINIEEGVVADFGDTTNYYFRIASTADYKTVTLKGAGTLKFDGNSTYALFDVHSGENQHSKFVVDGLKVESKNNDGYLAKGKLEINSGYFKNILFANGTSIESGFFTNNVSSYVKEGKMCVASSLEGYNFVVDDLDEAHASYSVKKANNVTKYYSTFSGAIGNCGSGDVFKILGEPSVINIDSDNNKFIVNDGATYDLNGHTLNYVGGTSYTIFAGSTDHEVTIKNGSFTTEHQTIDIINKEGDSDVDFILENVSFENKYKTSVLEQSSNGYFVQANDSFSINASAPQAYNAKTTLVVETGQRSEYYFNCDHSVEEALKVSTNGAYVEANVTESNTAQCNNLRLNDRITIALGDDVSEYPSFIAAEGEPFLISESNKVAEFEIRPAYFFSVTKASDTTYYFGNQILDAIDDFVSTADAEFNLLKDFTYDYKDFNNNVGWLFKVYASGLKLNLNGHTFDATVYYNAFFAFGADGSITVDGGGENGKLICNENILQYNGSLSTCVTLKNGYFECGSSKAFGRMNNKNSSLVFESGYFYAKSGTGIMSSDYYNVHSGTYFGESCFNNGNSLFNMPTKVKTGDAVSKYGHKFYKIA